MKNLKFKIENWKLKISAKQRGFTVLESIVAIFILSLSISGAFSAVQRGLSQAVISKDETQAFYLAQEAVEIIRNKRDSNQLAKINGSTITWLNGISENVSDPCYFGKVCGTESFNMNLVNHSSSWTSWNNYPVLNQDPTSFLFSYNNLYPATRFKREIQLERVRDDSLGNPLEIAVIVKIYWTKGIFSNEFKVKTHLFNSLDPK